MRGFNNLLPLKRVVKTDLYLGGGVVTSEIIGDATHAFADQNCIKNVSEKIYNFFKTTPKSYG